MQIVDENHFTVEATVDLSSNFFDWVFTSAGKMRTMASPETVDNFQMMLEINSNPPVKKSHLKGGQAQISKIFPEGVHLIAHLLFFS